MPLLLHVETDEWTLEIVGRVPALPPFLTSRPDSTIVLKGEFKRIDVLDPSKGQMQSFANGQVICPLFFEFVDYDIHLEKTCDAMLTLPAGAEARRIRQESEHHFLNFGNNVGFADLSIQTISGTASLRLEVFARKVDYRTDYVAMRDQVSAILRNLAMTANAKTYGLAAPSPDHHPTLIEWFALLQSHLQEFIKLASAISKRPHTGLRAREIYKNTDRARHVTRQTIERAMRRSNAGPLIGPLGLAMPRRISEHVSAINFDTPENRYFKGVLGTTYRNMLALFRTIQTGDEDGEFDSERRFFSSIRPTLRSMQRQLEQALRAPFLESVGEGTTARPLSMVFHKHPLYSRFDKLARLLNGGLSFAGNIVPIGVKDTALLYEYWCFLKLVELLRKNFSLRDQSVVKINRFRTTVVLAKGRSSAMQFTHIATGKPLFIVYNRLFDRLPTIAQKPDNVIQIASEDRFYIFDAKYRIQFDDDYLFQYGGPGPTTEDINTMHRYRDAIAIPHPLKPAEYKRGVVIGAAVLFPYPDEAAYQQHKFFDSLRQVEIGGLPFLPNSTMLVEAKLSALLEAEFGADAP